MLAVFVDCEYVQNCIKKARGSKRARRFMPKVTMYRWVRFYKERERKPQAESGQL
jgi:hypothetical protein